MARLRAGHSAERGFVGALEATFSLGETTNDGGVAHVDRVRSSCWAHRKGCSHSGSSRWRSSSFPRDSNCSTLSAILGDAKRAGTLWGAVEAEAKREPKQTTIANLTEYEPYLEPVRGDTFDEARLHGRTLALEEAVAYALSEQT